MAARAHEGNLARKHLATSFSAGSLDRQRKRIGGVAKGCFDAFAAYAPEPLAGRAVLFRATGLIAPSVDREVRYPWEELCSGGLEVHEVPCDHWSVLREPHVRRVAEIIEKCLAHAEEPDTSDIGGVPEEASKP
jgi:thioesterase domain-containing protein